ncbi:hypothetical protein F3Y22_tig00000340pilonHSYRG01207 [Hibiscus syriacus]|uniref:Reverse transcriptase domain-containing protein n=1 Tax=Hibiscus syriacus TaxID=106335 RepID=A0A6A3D8W1_HIBSY|nr:hypothetical protein F3Y22_tig00000340pilonHSYRG01207 [Hibiscus syriacus]
MVDEDTIKRNRFDEAKVLIQTQRVSLIPDRVLVSLNGSISTIKLRVENFEEERIFIDGRGPGGWLDVGAGVSVPSSPICYEVNIVGASFDEDFQQPASPVTCSLNIMSSPAEIESVAVEVSPRVDKCSFNAKGVEGVAPKLKATHVWEVEGKMYPKKGATRRGNRVTTRVEGSMMLLLIGFRKSKRVKTVELGQALPSRGLRRPEKVQAVRKTIDVSKARVVFLQESKMAVVKSSVLNRLQNCYLSEFVRTASDGASEGLISLWDTSVFTVERNIVSNRGIPIIIWGDFNTEIPIIPSSANCLVDFIQSGNLVDVPLAIKGGASVVASRLDRIILSPEIFQRCPNVNQSSLPRDVSDHNPVLLREELLSSGPRPFKIFSHWFEDEGFVDMIKTTCTRNSNQNTGALLKSIKAETKMGFGSKWRNWIRLCSSKASISVLVNGSPSRKFRIRRDLRQGCPLSPLLFDLIGEALSRCLSKAADVGLVKGVSVGLHVTHLQFADDLIVLAGDELKSVRNVKRVLRVFEVASGLSLNTRKTRIFGVNMDDGCIERVSWFWRNIVNPVFSDEDSFKKRCRFVVGDGKVADFDTVRNGVWDWNIALRRAPFDWELPIWDVFIRTNNRAVSARWALSWQIFFTCPGSVRDFLICWAGRPIQKTKRWLLELRSIRDKSCVLLLVVCGGYLVLQWGTLACGSAVGWCNRLGGRLLPALSLGRFAVLVLQVVSVELCFWSAVAV